MGKPKPPNGFYRESVHNGSSVTTSLLRVAPPDGMGKHSKSVAQRIRRHYIFGLVQEARRYAQREAIPNIMSMYHNNQRLRRV